MFSVFKLKKPNKENLLRYGFTVAQNGFAFTRNILDGQMQLTVTVSDGKVDTCIIDNLTGEEYVLYKIPEAVGAFVGQVREECSHILADIAEKCFEREIFKQTQTKRIIAYCKEKYGSELEFLWQKFPDNAIVRRKDNQKWYAAILTVSRRKLGFDLDESVEIIDLRMASQEIEKKADGARYFLGYHMNKKHWITVCLDGTLTDGELFLLIDESYRLAKK